MTKPLKTALAATLMLAVAAGCSEGTVDHTNQDQATSSADAYEQWNSARLIELRAPGYDDVHVDLAETPQRLAVDTFSAQALWPYGIRPAGIWGFGMDSPAMEDVDTSGMTVLGENNQFSLEKMAELNPDLMIGLGNTDGTGWVFWDEPTTEQVTAFCPFLPIGFWSGSSEETVESVIDGYKGVAKSLGADVNTPQIQADQKAFDEALSAVEAAASKRDDITVALIATEDDTLYFANDALVQVPALKKAGVTIVGPEQQPGPWTETSWEELPSIAADIILVNENGRSGTENQPLFEQADAVKAGQVYGWNDKRPFTYANYAEWFNELASHIEDAKDVTE